MRNLNLKTKVLAYLIVGSAGITLISVILALLLNCEIYGLHIVIFDVLSILLWNLFGYFAIYRYLKNKI